MEFLKRKKKRETEKREKGEKEEMKKRKEKGEKEEKKKAKKKKVRKVKGGKDGRRQSEKGGKKYLPSTSKEKCGSSSHASYFNSDGFDEKEWMTFSEEEKKDEVEYFTALQKWEKSYTKPTPAEADLLLAAENGNLKEVKRTIEEEGASVHIRSRDCGWTPLHLASSEPEVVQFLLKCGADPNATEHRHPDFLDEDQPVEIANRSFFSFYSYFFFIILFRFLFFFLLGFVSQIGSYHLFCLFLCGVRFFESVEGINRSRSMFVCLTDFCLLIFLPVFFLRVCFSVFCIFFVSFFFWFDFFCFLGSFLFGFLFFLSFSKNKITIECFFFLSLFKKQFKTKIFIKKKTKQD